MTMNNQLEVDNIMSRLKSRTALQTLSPQQLWRADLHQAIANLDWAEKEEDASVIALMAGLHLRNDNLPVSHSYSQRIEFESTGDYWHAIMHRMEQDYSNSKYWYRQVGNHPVKQAMTQKAAEYLSEQIELDTLGNGKIETMLRGFRDKQAWNSNDFVDVISLQENGEGNAVTRSLLEGLQQLELDALLDHSYRHVFES